jgi:Beta-carotene isomerase D27-like, C-terminal
LQIAKGDFVRKSVDSFPAILVNLQFSARMNAWATKVGGMWLMGECEVNDVVTEDGTVLKDQGLLVKRCRFLEESGCASVCVNSCKIPTQKFFLEDMGLPLTMTPDYETHECQFSFGIVPDAQEEFEARNTPCLSRCPTAGSMRKWHSGELPKGQEICNLLKNERVVLE